DVELHEIDGDRNYLIVGESAGIGECLQQLLLRAGLRRDRGRQKRELIRQRDLGRIQREIERGVSRRGRIRAVRNLRLARRERGGGDSAEEHWLPPRGLRSINAGR